MEPQVPQQNDSPAQQLAGTLTLLLLLLVAVLLIANLIGAINVLG
jgi:hypothetical protein